MGMPRVGWDSGRKLKRVAFSTGTSPVLTADNMNNGFIEITATGTVTVPAVTTGILRYVFTIYSTTAAVVHFDPASADKVFLNGVLQAAGEKISCDAVAGNSVTLIVTDFGSSVYGYRAIGTVGVWVNGG